MAEDRYKKLLRCRMVRSSAPRKLPQTQLKGIQMTTAETIINSSSNPFTEHQRQQLKDLSKVQEHGKDYSVLPNMKLEQYIETLKDMYPEKFHKTRADLESRVFFDEPTSITPHARSVRPRSQSPYQAK